VTHVLLVHAARSSSDSLRAVLDSVFASPNYRWAPPPDPFLQVRRWWLDLARWLDGLADRSPVLYWTVLSVLLLVLVAIFVHALWVVAQTLRAAGAPPEAPAITPARETRGAAWYRREAVRLAAAGRYPEAMSADFLGLVLELDAQNVLRYHPGKTPNEYTYEARLTEPSIDGFRSLVRALYRHVYAGEPSDAAGFAAWRERSSADRYASTN
jgi:hypothetical protein